MADRSQHNGIEFSQRNRLPALDAMRGLVMVLMTVDHASYAVNAGRYVTDSAAWYEAGSSIPALQFLVRWMTHICAPTFIFLAGLVMALSVASKQSAGASERRIDVDLFIRGVMIMALDPLWMSLGFGGGLVFQVLYAIGGGICCMAVIRTLEIPGLLIVGAVLMIGGEVIAGLAVQTGSGEQAGPLGALLATGGGLGRFGYVLYPLLPWLAYMVLGFACGRMVQQQTIRRESKFFACSGILLLLTFMVVRGLNGYGNMILYRDNASLLQWLHVSKYPPSLTFALLTLSLMSFALALFFRVYAKARSYAADPLLVFGRVPLFFYLLHVHLLSWGAKLTGFWKTGGLLEAFTAAGLVLLVLYPLCRWYDTLKKSRPNGLLRFV